MARADDNVRLFQINVFPFQPFNFSGAQSGEHSKRKARQKIFRAAASNRRVSPGVKISTSPLRIFGRSTLAVDCPSRNREQRQTQKASAPLCGCLRSSGSKVSSRPTTFARPALSRCRCCTEIFRRTCPAASASLEDSAVTRRVIFLARAVRRQHRQRAWA